jgi:glutamine amidotransferase
LSEESPQEPGLGIFAGNVVRFKEGKIPQIGWNLITAAQNDNKNSGHVYFVNSYYAQPQSQEIINYTANYHGEFCAAVKSKNISAVQFHPEKSGEFGKHLLKEWLDAAN